MADARIDARLDADVVRRADAPRQHRWRRHRRIAAAVAFRARPRGRRLRGVFDGGV